MRKFRVGDRVRYIGNTSTIMKGRTGVVVDVLRPGNPAVRWDDEPMSTILLSSPAGHNLELLISPITLLKAIKECKY